MLNTSSDSVMIEKANAMARINLFRKLAKVLQMAELVVLFTALSWSSTRLPAVIKFSFHYLLELSMRMFNPHVVFLIGNAIIVALFVLSRRSVDVQVSDCSWDSHDRYERNVDIKPASSDALASDIPSPPQSEETTDGDEDVVDIQMLCSENAVVSKNQRDAVSTAMEEIQRFQSTRPVVVSQNQCDAVAKAIEKATKQIERFQRTQSDKLKRRISVKTPKELRRSESEKRLVMVSSGERRIDTSYDKVDSLSDEEFNLTIEAFIKKHQKFFHAQKLAEQTHQMKMY